MSQYDAARAGTWGSAAVYDLIEQDIIRAYVRLAFAPEKVSGPRTIRLAQFGAVEVRLSETLVESAPSHVPPFWIEVYSYESDSIVDSCGCFEFDDEELSVAVELVMWAKQSQVLH